MPAPAPAHPSLTPEKACGDAAHFYGKEEPPPYGTNSTDSETGEQHETNATDGIGHTFATARRGGGSVGRSLRVAGTAVAAALAPRTDRRSKHGVRLQSAVSPKAARQREHRPRLALDFHAPLARCHNSGTSTSAPCAFACVL